MFRSLWVLIVLVFAAEAAAYDRVVLLAPAAGDLFQRLGQAHKVVGVTRSNEDFPDALRLGSHIKPNLELIKSLDPDLIVVASERFFSAEMARLVGADVFWYQPVTLDGVLTELARLGTALDCRRRANAVAAELQQLRQQIKPVSARPRVVYEVTEMPLTVAGKGNIAADIVAAAGGQLVTPSSRKLVKFSIEGVLMSQPDYYLYQQGPMNPSPTPPLRRSHYRHLNATALKVDQLRFSRANGHSFSVALDLNQVFLHQGDNL
ncbi:iron complex transport system substrate-binding protein [Ferrimonas sediminum]|uniref:Iron complex transport system substrate-binding protein n=2 Tax=Ferrimonas sediminum TaxID=718193 RepID=A0A1G8WMQ5_9GAMM|nr:iron complex transport system substrate-binding protein [Ferrimonas sediminum]